MINDAAHATKQCHTTIKHAHLPPSSLLTDAIAATQGVYRRLNTRRDAAVTELIAFPTPSPNSTVSVVTTLSFAMKPENREVTILQSPKPIGRNTGTRIPDISARMESDESTAGLNL